MTASASASLAVVNTTVKKRKRTGKQREEAKRAAIQAAQQEEQEAAINKKTAEDNDDNEEDEANEANEANEGKTLTSLPAPTVLAGSEQVTDTVELGSSISAVPEIPSEEDITAIAKRVPQALKTLNPLFKQAKREETMRLVKKIRFLRTKLPESKDEVSDLEIQLQLLSHISLQPLCASHLRLKLLKSHQLKHLPSNTLAPLHTAFPSSRTPSISAFTSSATPELISKVENRLTSAKFLAEGVRGAVAWVLGESGAVLKGSNLLGGKKKDSMKVPGAIKGKGRKNEKKVVDGEGKVEHEVDKEQEEEYDSDARVEFDDNEEEDGSEGIDDAGWESGSVSGAEYGARGVVASDDFESDSDSDTNTLPPSKRMKSTKTIKIKPPPGKPSTRANPLTISNKPASSIFLPSLSTGFVAAAGDEDSDPDMDYDPDGIIGKKNVAVRKNRRGQRARQAIWEKKYGKNAKHLVKSRKEEEAAAKASRSTVSAGQTRGSRFTPQSQDAGWGVKGGSSSGYKGGEGRGNSTQVSQPTNAGNNVTSTPMGEAGGTQNGGASVSSKSLHPSWEAARLRRQKELSGVRGGGDVPKATKIVFE